MFLHLVSRRIRALSVVSLLAFPLAGPLHAADEIKVPRLPGFATPAKETGNAATQPAPQSAPVAELRDLPALMPGAWKTLEGAEALRTLYRLVQALPSLQAGLLQDVRQLRAMALPFYDQATLVEARARAEDGAPILVHLVFGPWGARVLEGKSSVIHKINQLAPIHLDTADRARAYLRFFCGAVLGEEGPFNLVEQARDLWLKADADPALRAKVAAKLIPFEVSADPKGGWKARANVAYSDALFIANFHVQADGFVEMSDDQTVMADLPVRRIGHRGPARGEVCKDGVCPQLPVPEAAVAVRG